MERLKNGKNEKWKKGKIISTLPTIFQFFHISIFQSSITLSALRVIEVIFFYLHTRVATCRINP